VVAQLARELASARAEVAAARRGLAGALAEADDLRRERDRVLDLLVRQEAWLAQFPASGASAAAPAPTGAGSQLRTLLARLLTASRDRFRPASGRSPEPPRRLPPPTLPAGEEPPLVPFSRDGAPPRPVLLAAVQGLVPAELERLVAAVQARTAAAGVHVVFVTDCAELALFRRRGALVEYLPPAPDLERLTAADEVEIYLARRLDLLRRKWRPVRVVAYGEDAVAWLARLTVLPEAAEVRSLASIMDSTEDSAAQIKSDLP
jgi:hypothetical protein